jgi:hypothetical protein
MITPADSASSPAGYAAVTPHGRGPAPYDIQAGNDEAAITSQMNAANAVAGAGVLYPMGPRQSATEHLIMSPPGYGDFDITAGFSGSYGETWPGDASPPGA